MSVTVNHGDLILQSLSQMRDDTEFQDVSFRLGQTTVRASSFMLASASKELRAQITAPGSKKTFTVDDEYVTLSAFTQFISYVYTGILSINHDNVMPFVYLASQYKMRHLDEACIKYVEEHTTAGTALELFLLAKKFHSKRVSLVCQRIIRRETKAALDVPCWVRTPDTVLVSLCKDDHLSIDEVDLFELLVKWHKHNTPPSGEKSERLTEAFANIRYGAISATDLVGVVRESKLAPLELYVEALEYNADKRLFDKTALFLKKRKGPSADGVYSDLDDSLSEEEENDGRASPNAIAAEQQSKSKRKNTKKGGGADKASDSKVKEKGKEKEKEKEKDEKKESAASGVSTPTSKAGADAKTPTSVGKEKSKKSKWSLKSPR